jgi:adenosylmethionine-8-amino-7-oxononanoate aminotransferase
MYRLGPSTTSTILKETPDIAVYAKMLSGGYLPLAATLATSEVFDAFLGNKKWHALLHGHSYTVRNMCLGVYVCVFARSGSVSFVCVCAYLPSSSSPSSSC